jgi:hypothetical protein
MKFLEWLVKRYFYTLLFGSIMFLSALTHSYLTGNDSLYEVLIIGLGVSSVFIIAAFIEYDQ